MRGQVKRYAIGLVGSVAVHGAVVVLALGLGADRAPEPSRALPIELVATTAPAPPPKPATTAAAPEPKAEPEHAPRPRPRPRPKPAAEPEPVAAANAPTTPIEPQPVEAPTGEPTTGGLKPEASLDLRPYVPGGARLMVVVRTDRLRGTRWAPGLESVLSPMPDYQTVIAPSKLPLADTFETVVIATPNARDVTATFLAAKTSKSQADLKAALSGQPTHPRVIWREAAGGEVGTPVREGNAPEDPRVLLVPGGGWTLYTRPEHVAELLGPSSQAATQPATAPATQPATQPASPVTRPPWLDRLERVVAATGTKEGPVLVVAVADVAKRLRMLPGKPPAPSRGTLAVHAAADGFLLSGTLVFADDAAADTFLQAAEQRRREALDGVFSRGMLKAAHALAPLEKLTLTRHGAAIELTTALSADDAAVLLEHAAAWSRDYFDARRAPP